MGATSDIASQTAMTAGREAKVAKGTTFKICACVDPETGKNISKTCPKLRTGHASGGRRWSSTHGTWAYQLELPAHADGRRRTPLRRRGFATLEEAEAGWITPAACSPSTPTRRCAGRSPR
ncbi:hypothetical protein GCM10009734_95720 [Nonomuraea bangladeshensis]